MIDAFFRAMNMMGNYNERKVDRYDSDGLVISTARVTDGKHPYETAVSHTSYNKGEFVIVEAYDTVEAAREGHNKWVETMTSEDLPAVLVDCVNSEVSQLLKKFGGAITFERCDG